jgi:predicted nucleotidyltransferase
VFSSEDRQRLRAALVSAAHADDRVVAAALFGSAAVDREDRWSDIDLGLSLAAGVDVATAVADWTAAIYRDHAAVHHLDVARGEILYRVFLLASTLQVDLSFWPGGQLRAVGPGFRLLFGRAADAQPPAEPNAEQLIGTAWLYGLHARASIARARLWQAEYMISGARDGVLALACLRNGLPTRDGRGMDDLPADATRAVTPALVGSLDPVALKGALAATIDALLAETQNVDAELARHLGLADRSGVHRLRRRRLVGCVADPQRGGAAALSFGPLIIIASAIGAHLVSRTSAGWSVLRSP